MRYLELRKHLKDFTLFSLGDIKKIDPGFHRRRLSEWQDKDYIVKIINGHYLFSDTKVNEAVLFEIANRIYQPSYVSFEMALAHYGLIPESVYGITSASTRRTYRFHTPVADFIYRTIKPALFFGYEIVKYDGKTYKIASPEKAILDYFYLNPNLKNAADYAGLRINQEVFSRIVNREKLEAYLSRINQKNLRKRMNSFGEFMSDA